MARLTWDDCRNEAGLMDVASLPDIHGLGVIIGFLGPGLLASLLIVAYYLAGFDPSSHKPIPGTYAMDETTAVQGQVRKPSYQIDEVLVSALHNSFHRYLWPVGKTLIRPVLCCVPRHASPDIVEQALTKCILSLCDIQLFAGLCLLSSGFLSLSGDLSVVVKDDMPFTKWWGEISSLVIILPEDRRARWNVTEPPTDFERDFTGYELVGAMSALDWYIIGMLAWFSNLTNQAALVFLRKTFQNHPRQRAWRLLLMVLLLVMLVVSIVPTAFFDWTDIGVGAFTSSPALCFYDYTIGRERYANESFYRSNAFQEFVIVLSILCVSSCWRGMKLFDAGNELLEVRIRPFLSGLLRTCISRISSWTKPSHGLRLAAWEFMFFKPLLAIYILGRLGLNLLSSKFFDLFLLLTSASVGVMRLNTALPSEARQQWNFSQILALFLLLGPLITVVQIFGGDLTRDPPTVSIPRATFTPTASLPTFTLSRDSRDPGTSVEIQASPDSNQNDPSQPHVNEPGHRSSASNPGDLAAVRFALDTTLSNGWMTSVTLVMVWAHFIFLVQLMVLNYGYFLRDSLPILLSSVSCYILLCFTAILLGLAIPGACSTRGVVVSVTLLLIATAAIPTIFLLLSGYTTGGYPVADVIWNNWGETILTLWPLVLYLILCPIILLFNRLKGSQGRSDSIPLSGLGQ